MCKKINWVLPAQVLVLLTMFFTCISPTSIYAPPLQQTNMTLDRFAAVAQWHAVILKGLLLCVVAAANSFQIGVITSFCVENRRRQASFSHLILQLAFVSESWWHSCFPACSQESCLATIKSSRGREVKAMDSKSIGVSPRRFKPCRLRFLHCPFVLITVPSKAFALSVVIS